MYQSNRIHSYKERLTLWIDLFKDINRFFKVEKIGLAASRCCFDYVDPRIKASLQRYEKIPKEIVKCLDFRGDHIKLHVGNDYLAAIYVNRLPNKIIININRNILSYDERMIGFIHGLGTKPSPQGSEKDQEPPEQFCLPFYLETVGTQCIVGAQIEIEEIELFFADVGDVSIKKELLVL